MYLSSEISVSRGGGYEGDRLWDISVHVVEIDRRFRGAYFVHY
jgi:hypothetical protein